MRFVFVSEIAAGCGARRSLSTQTSRSGRLANEIEIEIGESALSWGGGEGVPEIAIHEFNLKSANSTLPEKTDNY